MSVNKIINISDWRNTTPTGRQALEKLLEDEHALEGVNLILSVHKDGTSAFTLSSGTEQISRVELLGYVKLLEDFLLIDLYDIEE